MTSYAFGRPSLPQTPRLRRGCPRSADSRPLRVERCSSPAHAAESQSSGAPPAAANPEDLADRRYSIPAALPDRGASEAVTPATPYAHVGCQAQVPRAAACLPKEGRAKQMQAWLSKNHLRRGARRVPGECSQISSEYGWQTKCTWLRPQST